MGEPRALAQIEALLATLDVRQPQVMLEVLIVSLSESQTLDLGVELDKQTTIGDARVRLSSLFGLGTRGSGGDRTVGDGAGFTGLVLSPGDFSIVLRALQTLNKGRSLSMPRLLVANNQQGTIDSVLTQPYASTNASNTVTTTSYGGAQDAGTQVTLKPQIGAGDHLNLDYSISLSAFIGAPASANLPPPKQQNRVQSAASLPDGYTVAVGGIELNSEGQGTSQVPGLGSIPILGEAFRNRSKNASRSRFYIFIRANVLRNENYEDLKYASEIAAGRAGVDDGFPVVEPRVIR
jgi:general secretion pathway protein D